MAASTPKDVEWHRGKAIQRSAARPHRAVFLDRDGTLVEARHYPSRPEDLLLIRGVDAWLRCLQEGGFRLVVITNQSGLAHGFFTAHDLQSMHDHLVATLAGQGVCLDGIYYCPHHPHGTVPSLRMECACRKPRPGLLLRAAAELQIDLQRSWFLGDILDDVEAGNRAGCRTVLVDLATEQQPGQDVRQPTYVAQDTLHALMIVAAVEGLGPETDLRYIPETWQRPRTDASCAPAPWVNGAER